MDTSVIERREIRCFKMVIKIKGSDYKNRTLGTPFDIISIYPFFEEECEEG